LYGVINTQQITIKRVKIDIQLVK